jgi:glycosyltransferase involved in cell wall biosynthesis
MRIAIVHDYIKEYGGAERVLEELHKLFPDAPIYTSLYAPEYLGPHLISFKQMTIKTSFLQLIPFKEKFISIFRLISPAVFRSFNLSEYGIIIVSQTGAYFPNLVKKGRAKLICYTHTPPRYLYGYMTAREWQKNILMRLIGFLVNHFLRMVDFRASQKVDYFIANSEEVKSRIGKFYKRDSIVIYPPVNIPNVIVEAKKKDYYLAGGRLARAKGIDIAVQAFNKNRKKLKIFGKGFAGYGDELKKIARSNIEFLGEVSEAEKQKLMAEAKGFVFPSFDEDFGITPVEAMAQGTPVIAFKSGGVKETVVHKKTGVFYNENTPESLNKAISDFEKMRISAKACIDQAQKFSSENFDGKMLKFVNKIHNA